MQVTTVKLDSLPQSHELIEELIQKVDSLSNELSKIQVSDSYFSDILSHQWALLTIQTGIFVLIFVILLTFVGLVSWKAIIQKYNLRLQNIESKLDKTDALNTKLEELEGTLKNAANHALRSLYESKDNNLTWKIIWHIRYIEWFVDNGKTDSIKTRIAKLTKEYKTLKKDAELFNSFIHFTNKGGLKRILKKLINTDIKEIMPTVTEILKDLS